MIYAVDFDGTIVEDRFPQIGKLIPFALESLRKLQSQGHTIILWTCRHEKDLEDALKFLKENNFIPDVVNDHSAQMLKLFPGPKPKKIYADIYIDDHDVYFYKNLDKMKNFWVGFYNNL